MANDFNDLLTSQRKCVACKQYKSSEEFERKTDRTCGPCKAIIKKAKEAEKERKERDRLAQIGKR